MTLAQAFFHSPHPDLLDLFAIQSNRNDDLGAGVLSQTTSRPIQYCYTLIATSFSVDSTLLLRRLQISFIRSCTIPRPRHTVHAHLRAGSVRPRRCIRWTAFRSLVWQEEKTTKYRATRGSAAGAVDTNHRQVRFQQERPTEAPTRQLDWLRQRVRIRAPDWRRNARKFLRQYIWHRDILSNFPSRTSSRNHRVDVRLAAK